MQDGKPYADKSRRPQKGGSFGTARRPSNILGKEGGKVC
jgi:hypothetical protein